MTPQVRRALELTPELLRATGEELGWLETSAPLVFERIAQLAHPTDVDQVTRRTSALLNGSLLLYLFALWQSHMPNDYKEWMTKDERIEFEAYEHVRDSVAHGPLGHRAENRRKRKAFEAHYPFAGIGWDPDADRIDISTSTVVDSFLSVMMGMSSQLVARFHGGTKPGAA